MKHCGTEMIRYMVVVLLLKLWMTKGSLSCHVQQKENGTFSFSVSSSQTCEEYSWKIKGEVVACEGRFNETLVLASGRSNIVFKSCQTNVSYFCDKKLTEHCNSTCPTQAPHHGKTYEGNPIGGVLPVIIVIAVVVVVIIGVAIVWWKLNKS